MVDKDFAWRLAQELVRIDSSDPGAYEDEIERYIKVLVEERLARLNHPTLDAVQIKELEVLPGRRNLIVTVPGQSDEPRLVYICHMDTVTLGDGWDAGIPPLGAIVRDDKLYGRGAVSYTHLDVYKRQASTGSASGSGSVSGSATAFAASMPSEKEMVSCCGSEDNVSSERSG